MSRYHSRAGTRKCTTPVADEPLAGSASSAIGSPQSVHVVSMRTGSFAIAATPNMSQAQLAHHDTRAPLTRYGVGTAENGPAIQISPEQLCGNTVLPIL